MAKQSFVTGQVLTAAQLTSLQQTAMLGGLATAKTTSYTLVAADAGTVVSVNSTSATTITVNTGLFSAGDTVTIQNWGSGAVTITAGTATVNTAGSLIVPQYDGGVLYFTSASAAIYFDFVQAGAVSPLTTKGDLYGFGSSDARIPIGTNGQILTADSAETLGLKWATPAGGGGKVLQVVQSLTTGYIAITSNDTYGDANLSATITPTSASSKILVMLTQAINFYTDSASQPNSAWCRIMRGGTAVWNSSPTESTIGLVRAALDGPRLIMAMNYLDSPATTSSTTYKPQYKQSSNANAHTLYFNYGDVQSTITLMEIGA